MRLIYHPDAEEELIKSARFYEKRVPGLGAEFLDAADQAIARIKADPELNRILSKGVRRYIVPRFPFSIFYRLHADHIRILAVKHNSRRPDYWHYRNE